MGDHAVYLVGMDPPDNLLTQLLEIDRRLLHTFGIVSGLSLDPAIPVCALAERPDKPALSALPRLPPLQTGQWIVVESSLFLSLDPEEALRGLIEGMQASFGDETIASPVPLYPAIYLSRLDDPPPGKLWPESEKALSEPTARHHEEIIATLGPPPELRWTGAALRCRRIEIEVTRGIWRAARSELCWTVRLRGERRIGD